MKNSTAAELIEVKSWDDIPDFDSEDEEADFWGTHYLSDELWDESEVHRADVLPPPGTPMGVRLSFSPEIAERARALARKRGTDYVTLIHQFVCERLAEEEARES